MSPGPNVPIDVDTVNVVFSYHFKNSGDKLLATRAGSNSRREVGRVGPSTDGNNDFGVVTVGVLDKFREETS